MPVDASAGLGMVLYQHDQFEVSYALAGMCMMESSLKVRKYFPEVKQNMDYLGAHNNLLKRGLGELLDINHPWLYWKKRFQDQPEEGTAIAVKVFKRLVEKNGLDNAVQLWKVGKVGTVRGLEYLMQVKALAEEVKKNLRSVK